MAGDLQRVGALRAAGPASALVGAADRVKAVARPKAGMPTPKPDTAAQSDKP